MQDRTRYIRAASALSVAIVLLGILLRLAVYAQNRSLIIDEANLARNIVLRDYSGFFTALDYQQYAPPLFLVLAKAATQLLGVREQALALPALLGGTASLIWLLLLSRRLHLAHPARWYLLLLWAFSMLALRYSTECKQYALDAALALLFVHWALWLQEKPLTPARAAWLGIGGSVAIWLSMPVVFVLAALGLALLYRSWRSAAVVPLGRLWPVGTAWVLSFAAYYVLLLHGDAHHGPLRSYHSAFFFNFLPRSTEAFWQSWHLLMSLFQSLTDPTLLSLSWAMLSFVVGGRVLARQQGYVASLLLLPILFCLLASQWGLYSLIPRLTLFMLPLILLVMGTGITELWQRARPWARVLMLVPMLVSVANTGGYKHFWERMEHEDSKGALDCLAAMRKGSAPIYVHHDGVPAFVFYNTLHAEARGLAPYHLASWDEMPADAMQRDTGHFWLFFSHTFPQENIDANLRSAASLGMPVDSCVRLQASVYEFAR